MGEHYSSRVTERQSAGVRSEAASGMERDAGRRRCASRRARFRLLLPALALIVAIGPMPTLGARAAGVDDVEMIEIPTGWFVMGSAEADADQDEQPVARIFVDGFWIDKHEVTNRRYQRCVDAGACVVPIGSELGDRGRADHPVAILSWRQATDYCRWAGKRLPTEAEWEKAARGGLEGKRYPWGDTLDRDKANFLAEPLSKNSRGTSACRTFPPNGYGLYDMAGNVWEWVHDWHSSSYYATSPLNSPAGPREGTLRVVRGGSWLAAETRMLSCSHRHKVPPDTYSYGIGFRIACSA